MLELKGLEDSGMDCEDLDLSVDGNTGKRPHRLGSDDSENDSHKMKRLKSLSESGTNKSSDHGQVRHLNCRFICSLFNFIICSDSNL